MRIASPAWLATAPLPPVWQGRRRRPMSLLLATGVAQGGLAIGAGVAMSGLSSASAPTVPTVLALGLAALGLGGLRVLETVYAERLGQKYVAQVRRLIINDALGPARSPNVGITIARATNDLAAVLNWVALGLGRLLAGMPLIIGVLIALWVLSPVIAGAIAACLLVLGLCLKVIAPTAFHRYRELRKRRGRMASFVADAVRAAPSIYAAGGVARELKTVDKLSGHVEKAAVTTASAIGAMRGVAAAVATVMLLVATVAGVASGENTTTITTVLLLVSVLSGPVTDLGRVVELRQGFNAARVVIGPVIERSYALQRLAKSAHHLPNSVALIPGQVHLAGITGVPELVANPGARIRLQANSAHAAEPVLAALLGADPEAYLAIGGLEVDLSDDRNRRKTLGVVSADMEVEQGSIARAVRYRRPDSDQSIDHLLAGLGLTETIKNLPKKTKTKLRRGGEPLTPAERTRLLVARALYSTPPIILLTDISLRLCQKDLTTVRHILAHYPGVVIVMDNDGDVLVPDATVWDVHSDRRVVLAGTENGKEVPQ